MGRKANRNTSIEALRLVAVAGIAIFHTFQWTFQAVCTGLPEYVPLAAFPYSGALGFINLLGCWANEVFFMISGYFLIPSAVRALQNGSSAQDLTLKSLGRLKKIVLPTLFYCAVCLLVSMYVYPLPEISLHEIGWLTLGIEFIWVYAASVLLVPVIASIRQRIGSIKARLSKRSSCSQHLESIATSRRRQTKRRIVLWRKLMSAVTYLVAFIAAGEMRFVLEYHGNASGAQKSKIVLIGLVGATIALELLLSANSQYDALWKLSYKSLPSYPFILLLHPLPPQHSISRATKSQLQTRQSYLSPQERSLSTPCSRLPATSGEPSSTMQSTPWQQASKRESPVQPPPFCSESL